MKSLLVAAAVAAALSLAHGRAPLAQRPPQGVGPGGSPDAAGCRKFITVGGGVRAPMRIELRRDVRLLEALATAGGVTEQAGRTVRLTRPANGPGCDGRAAGGGSEQPVAETQIYDLDDVRAGTANPLLRHGDVVTVAEKLVVYVVGAVARPQGLYLEEPATVTQAVAAAGGARPDAKLDRVIIYRRRAAGGAAEVIKVDLKAIRKRRAAEVLLQTYDIVEVPCKGCGGHPFGPMYPGKTELPTRVIY